MSLSALHVIKALLKDNIVVEDGLVVERKTRRWTVEHETGGITKSNAPPIVNERLGVVSFSDPDTGSEIHIMLDRIVSVQLMDIEETTTDAP